MLGAVCLGSLAFLCNNLWVSKGDLSIALELLWNSLFNQTLFLAAFSSIAMLLYKGLQVLFFNQLLNAEKEGNQNEMKKYGFRYVFMISLLDDIEVEDWFSLLIIWVGLYFLFAGLHSFVWLCKQRQLYLMNQPPSTSSSHAKIVVLLCGLFVVNLYSFWALLPLFYRYGGLGALFHLFQDFWANFWNIVKVLSKVSIYFYDNYHLQTHSSSWEHSGSLSFHIDAITDIFILAVKTVYNMFLIFMYGFSFSVTGLLLVSFLYLDLHSSWKALNHKIEELKKYRKITQDIENRFSRVSQDEINRLDDKTCAICWDENTSASSRRLPCNHIFHNSCMRTWFEKETFCPLCKRNILPQPPPSQQNRRNPNNNSNISRLFTFFSPNQRPVFNYYQQPYNMPMNTNVYQDNSPFFNVGRNNRGQNNLRRPNRNYNPNVVNNPNGFPFDDILDFNTIFANVHPNAPPMGPHPAPVPPQSTNDPNNPPPFSFHPLETPSPIPTPTPTPPSSPNSDLETSLNFLQEVLPHVPRELLLQDLLRTRNPEQTINNFLST
eukprot:TRINITY_DN4188_c0_g1_i1.p1 TRINITY_DN4188_c0_g1~~TRINITY_DN4188_c0_g1_i1.p1  ORF type:complete len:581 (+),score=87.91 TRINITY_DN4188_c0_g1_i1:101-1744(+)